MRISLITILSLLISSILFSKTFTEKDFAIFESKSGNALDVKELAKKTKKYDVLFWGELHDDMLIHKLEKDILPYLLKTHKRIAISMEMFERDTQEILDKYLKGEISEKDFIKKSRAWPNYLTDYKPIIEFAKKHNIDVIAANVPRRYAAMINKKGIKALDKISEKEKNWVAKNLKVLPGKYKKIFIETMTQNMGGGNSPMMAKMFENIYAAQCLKDDTMAESIYQYLKSHPGTFIIHYNGDFHSNSHLGTAEKLHLLDKNLKIAVVSPIVIEKNQKPTFKKEYTETGDFVLVMHRFAQDKTDRKAARKMFKNVNNSIIVHNINITIKPSEHALAGYDEIEFAKPVSAADSLFLLSSLDVKEIIANGNRIPFTISDKNSDYQKIIIMAHGNLKKIKIKYGGKIYFPLTGRNLNQTHDSTLGIISAKQDEGIYLPGGNWYPYMNNELASFDVKAKCPSEFTLMTSGKLTENQKGNYKYYHWVSELPVDHISMVGNRFIENKRIVNGVILGTLLLKEDSKYSKTYLDAMEKYLKAYGNLFGKYPFSSFYVVENFFASGFGMPNYTLLAKQIVKMPFITLSPGVIAHEFCHNWWGNSVYVDYSKGNWCEALTVFSSNYYWNILDNKPKKALEWRKSAIIKINLLSPDKNFPLKEFVYQHNDEEATIGYQKGAFLFITLYNIMGKDNFFSAVKDFYKTYQGKIAYWEDIRDIFKKYLLPNKKMKYDLDKFFEKWLYSTKLPEFYLDNITYDNETLRFNIYQKNELFYQNMPIKINFNNGSKTELYDITAPVTEFKKKFNEKPQTVELDPESYVLKKLPKSAMPYSLNRTLNDKPLVVLPNSGDLLPRLKMVVGMLQKSGYNISSKKASEVNETDLKNKSLLIFGDFKNNPVLSKIKYPKGFSIVENGIIAQNKNYTSDKASIILNFQSPFNEKNSVSIYAWNSKNAITSFRKIFHYMNDSWLIFDLDRKGNGAIDSGELFSNGKNPFVYEVK